MDGLAAGVASIACASYFAIAVTDDQGFVATLAAGVIGCAVGFLRSNRYPARIYMGDGGALFLGFLVAYLGLKLKVAGDGYQTFLVPLLVCLIAILDTTVVVVSRLRSGKSPFQGGLDHTSHRLVHVGLPVPIAVGVIHLAALIAGALAFICTRVDAVSVWIVGGLAGVSALGATVFFLAIPIYAEDRPS